MRYREKLNSDVVATENSAQTIRSSGAGLAYGVVSIECRGLAFYINQWSGTGYHAVG